MFINGSHIFSKNVFVLPIWEEKITCTASRMPLLCWFLLIFPHHFKCYFFGILVFRLNPPQYVKPSHKEETDWLDVLMSTLTYTDLSWLKITQKLFLSTTVEKFIYHLSWDSTSQLSQNFGWNFTLANVLLFPAFITGVSFFCYRPCHLRRNTVDLHQAWCFYSVR